MASHLQFRFLYFVTALSVLSTATFAAISCKKRLKAFNPEGLIDASNFGYSQVTVDRKNAVAYIAGQTALNSQGGVDGKTLREQYDIVVNNLLIALKSVGADVDDILKLNGYIVNYDPQRDMNLIVEVGKRLGSPASTIAGIPTLAVEGLLVEVELVAAVSHRFISRLPC